MSDDKIIGRKIKLPQRFEKIITTYSDCPFYDDGDEGYGCHCNLADLERLRFPLTLCELSTCRYLELIPVEEEQSND